MAPRKFDIGIDPAQLEAVAREMGLLPDKIQRGIIATVNEAADDTVSRGISYITERIGLTPEYISKHLRVTKRASNGSDIAIITANRRPVLLSRFDARQAFRTSRDKRGRSGGRVRGGVSVAVKPGQRHTMASAFLIRLKGSGVTGVAVRPTAENRSAFNKREWKEADNLGYAVLHGPSVSQLIRSALTDGVLMPPVDEFAANLLKRITNV
jgi:hypothetical protein